MNGFLSDRARDVIAVIGLLLAIAQTIMAIVSIKKMRLTYPIQISGILRKVREGFRRVIRKHGGVVLPSEFQVFVTAFVILTLLVFTGAFILHPPFENPELSIFKNIVFAGLFFLATIQVASCFYFIAVVEDFLNRSSKEFRSFTYLNIFISSGLLLVILFTALLGGNYLNPKAGWIRLALSVYVNQALEWSVIFLVFYFIQGAVVLIKDRSN